MKKRNKFYSLIIVVSLSLLIAGLWGCKSEGPAEKAGKTIDKSVKNIKEKAESVKDELTDKGPAEKAGEKIDEAVKDVQE